MVLVVGENEEKWRRRQKGAKEDGNKGGREGSGKGGKKEKCLSLNL